jgi:hypothetical protein
VQGTTVITLPPRGKGFENFNEETQECEGVAGGN